MKKNRMRRLVYGGKIVPRLSDLKKVVKSEYEAKKNIGEDI